MTYEELRERLNSDANVERGTGVAIDEVDHAERLLDVVFGSSYRSFLIDFGWVSVGSIELYGLGADIPPYLDVVKETLWERIEAGRPLPHHLIPIVNTGGGDHYCLDSSRVIAGECPIVFYDHELDASQEPSTVAADFATWLAEKVLS